MLKLLFLFHRYTGIALGLVMVIWCLSGIIMMYKPYPELTEAQQLSTLPMLNQASCCLAAILPVLDQTSSAFSIRITQTNPVLRLYSESGAWTDFDLLTGKEPEYLQPEMATEIASIFAVKNQLGTPVLEQLIPRDQWTVYGAYNPYRPLFLFQGNDAKGTQWYISQRTGDIVQITTTSQRVWGYLGAVIHWFYPTVLRQHVALWSNTVIWLTIAGTFLVASGLYFGIRQLRKRRNNRYSPYTGLSKWHHYSGLIFGFLTLTWVFSGLFSMNPWGLLEGEGIQDELALIRGSNITMPELAALLPGLNLQNLPADTRMLEGEKRAGKLHLFAVQADASRIALDPHTLTKKPLAPDTLQKLAGILLPPNQIAEASLLASEDSYYYNHHEQVKLPVWRIISSGNSRTRYYLNPENAALIRKIDPEKRWYRWVFYGVHRGDFTQWLRTRPIWDLVVGFLLAGVSVTCITGFCAGIRRLGK